MVIVAAEVGNTHFVEIGQLLDNNIARVDEFGLENARLACYVCQLWLNNVCLGLLSDGVNNRHIGVHLRGSAEEQDDQLTQILEDCLLLSTS